MNGGIYIKEEKIQQIYDKIFKKVLTLSKKSVINMINGLFDTNYPLDSNIDYNWTEFIDDNISKILADTIITINYCNHYHIEAQMYEDEDIVLRIFQYGLGFSIRERKNPYVLKFPESKILYLGSCNNVPEFVSLILDFGEQGQFEYKVKTFVYQDISVEELNQKNLINLIPFQLLRLKDLLKKDHCKNNLSQLKHLVTNDIMGSIERNLSVGNITESDARRLLQLTRLLYQHLYSKYNQMEVIDEMDESIILEYEHLEHKFEELEQRISEQSQQLSQQEQQLSQQEQQLSQQEQHIKLLQNKNHDYEQEIQKLKSALAKSKS